MDYQNIPHFYRFNGMRFVAALLVVIHHGESLRAQAGLFHLKSHGLFQNGSRAVTFFFVLSGFLISYLLMKENHQAGRIRIKSFYLKRVYRIWPLYFIMVIIGVFLQPLSIRLLNLPYILPYTWGETWAYFIFFVPGLVTFFHGSHLLQPLWSIGVEEVFYLIWAPLFQICRRILLWMFLGVVIVKITLALVAQSASLPPVLHYLIQIHQFESMAAGAIAAYALFHHGEKMIKHRRRIQSIQWLVVALSLFLLRVPYGMNEHPLYPLVLSAFFALLLLSFTLTNTQSRLIDSKIVNFLGEISYGIYMYHLLVLTLVLEWIKVSGLGHLGDTLLFYGMSLSLTVLLAGLSKRYVENYFLKFRRRLH